ncbi:MAG: hypothetical protein ISN28_08505 [Ectothiorhodospiraceae bacterium AqS1]|nr:hypothetical protein [Ectothiorhodospiraceae bacterium AqS1]
MIITAVERTMMNIPIHVRVDSNQQPEPSDKPLFERFVIGEYLGSATIPLSICGFTLIKGS